MGFAAVFIQVGRVVVVTSLAFAVLVAQAVLAGVVLTYWGAFGTIAVLYALDASSTITHRRTCWAFVIGLAGFAGVCVGVADRSVVWASGVVDAFGTFAVW